MGTRAWWLLVLWSGLAGLALLTWQVHLQGPAAAFDPRLADWLHAHAHATPALLAALLFLTHMHSTPGLLALAGLGAALLLGRRRRRAALFLLGSQAGVQLLNAGLKLLFLRARPEFEEPLVLLSSHSFPSGHSAGSMALYAAFALLAAPSARLRMALAGLLLVLLVGFSRIFLGAHYLSDVLAGYATGLAWVALCRLLFDPSGPSARPGAPPA